MQSHKIGERIPDFWDSSSDVDLLDMVDCMMQTKVGSAIFETSAQSLVRMLQRNRMAEECQNGNGQDDDSDALPLSISLHSKRESTLLAGLNEVLYRLKPKQSTRHVLPVNATVTAHKLATKLVNFGAMESCLTILTTDNQCGPSVNQIALEVLQIFVRYPAGIAFLVMCVEDELNRNGLAFTSAAVSTQRTFNAASGRLVRAIDVLLSSCDGVLPSEEGMGSSNLTIYLNGHPQRAKLLFRNLLSAACSLFVQGQHMACRKLISLLHLISMPSPPGRDSRDADLRTNTEDRELSPQRADFRWFQEFESWKPCPGWIPTEAVSGEAGILAKLLSNLDEYGRHQKELRHIIWVLGVSTEKWATLFKTEISKISTNLLHQAERYMTSVLNLITTQDIAPIPQQFDESLFYHFFQSVIYMRNWNLPAFENCLQPSEFALLGLVLSAYLTAIGNLMDIEKLLVEEAPNRRLIRTRHVVRVPYLVDCVRMVGLASAQSILESDIKENPRFIQTFTSNAFEALVLKHVDLLNNFIRKDSNSNDICSSEISGRLTHFETRLAVFRHRLANTFFPSPLDHDEGSAVDIPSFRINVRRREVLKDSIDSFKHNAINNLGKFFVKFEDEPASGNGVMKEWFQAVGLQLFDEHLGFFRQCPNSNFVEVDPNCSRFCAFGDNLHVYKFCGQFLALALVHNVPVSAPINAATLKYLLGIKIRFTDLKGIDHELQRHLEWLLNNPVEPLCLSFTHGMEFQGKVVEVLLKTNGDKAMVTDENKSEYVALVATTRAVKTIRPQLKAMREGFASILPRHCSEVMLVEDVSKMIFGATDIDVDDWESNTELVGWKSHDQTVVWFFGMLRDFTHLQRTQVLRFVTALNRPPCGGFARLSHRFRICKTQLPQPLLPVSRTCFSELVIPEYASAAELRRAMCIALEFGGIDSFGLA